jgi:hypothetical protein
MNIGSIADIFLGATLSFIVAYLTIKLNDKRKIKILKSNIKDELMGVYDALEHSMYEEKIQNAIIHIPIWEAIVSSALLLDLVKNKDYYDSIIEIYFAIQRLKEEEKGNILGKNDISVKKLRKEICQKIKNAKI